jgi:DNA-binding MarR family transcriptional regulator
MPVGVNYARVEKKSLAAVRARDSANKHAYFVAVAHVRYILRKVIRMIEDKASELGLASLEHQALLQVYGSPTQQLRVNELAERLDIAPPFASNLIKDLIKRKFLKRGSDSSDLRVTVLQITNAGRELCHRIDAEVRPHVDYFTRQLTADERETALSTLMFYVGPGAPGARDD